MINEPVLDIKGNRKIIVISEPIEELITVAELKEYARIDHDHEDTLLEGLIITSRKCVEYYLKRKLLETSLRVTMDKWNTDVIELPYPPLISITGVYYVYEDDTTEEYDSDYYYVDINTEPGRLCIKDGVSIPINTDRCHGGYRIDFKAGYGSDAEDVPEPIKTAIKIWATELYEGRTDIKTPPKQAGMLLAFYRNKKL